MTSADHNARMAQDTTQRRMKHPEPKPAGTWDYFGACAPTPKEGGGFDSFMHGQETFTLGCFVWEPKARSGTKRGKVVYRVKGFVSDPQAALDIAEAWCRKRNAQEAAE